MIRAPRRHACPGCGGQVLDVDDADTGERLVLDYQLVDEGHVRVLAAGPAVVARQSGKPARVQPAYRVHRCPTPVAETTDRDVDDPGLEQARWRAP